ncbi:MAG: signal peptidase I [Minicystis sp.]
MEKFFRGLAWTAGILAAIGLLLRLLVFDVWTIPDNDPKLAASIVPTLRAGDIVLVLKRGEVGVGSLVRCADPEDPTGFIAARIAGVPGDRLDIDGRHLNINGIAFNGESVCPLPSYTVIDPSSGASVVINCDRVTMGGGWHYRAYSQKPRFAQPKSNVTVGEGMVYLLSDDRDFHDDSRDFGPVPRSSCKGPIVFRIWGKGGFFGDSQRFEYIH